MLASLFSSSLLLPKTSGPSEGENQFKLPSGTGTPYELVHFFKLPVFHCLLRETLLCLTEIIQSTQMMESLSVTGFKRFSLGWTKSDLYVSDKPTVPLQHMLDALLYVMLFCWITDTIRLKYVTWLKYFEFLRLSIFRVT